MNTIRINGRDADDRFRDGWLSRSGDEFHLELPDGRVTLRHHGMSANGIHYTTLNYKPIRRGLSRFSRERT